jgi:lysozyme
MQMINCIIDISHHQQSIDFGKVKAAGVVGVIHKATGGTDYRDPMYDTNRQNALAAGLLWGAYHWGTGDASGADQAQYFLDYAQPDGQTLLALDYEPNVAGAKRLGPDMNPQQATDFVNAVQGSQGRFPVLYTGMAMAGHFPNLPNCPLWWARYAPTPKGIPTDIWPTWTLWQYTDGINGNQPHTVDGIDGACDRDQFNGDLDALQRFWGVA